MKRYWSKRIRSLLFRSHRNWRAWGALTLAVGLFACQSDSMVSPVPPPPPGPKNGAELSFLRQAGSAPALTTLDTTIIATRGMETRVRIRYAPLPGETEGEEFLELDIDDTSLLRYPPGHPRAGQLFQDGDTVSIRIRIDPTDLLVTLDPSGIEFDSVKPAELEIRYGNADDDYDDDGTVDPPESENRIDLWRQEKPGDPWFPVGEIKDRETDRVRARLTSFSRYALAI